MSNLRINIEWKELANKSAIEMASEFPLFFADCELTAGFWKRVHQDDDDVLNECPILRVKAVEFCDEDLKDFRFVLDLTDGSSMSFRRVVLDRELTASVEKRKVLITKGDHVQLIKFNVIPRFDLNSSKCNDIMVLVSKMLIGEEEIQAQNYPERPGPKKGNLKRKMEVPPNVITSTQFGSGFAGESDELNLTIPESPIEIIIPETENYSEKQTELEAETGVDSIKETQPDDDILLTRETQAPLLCTSGNDAFDETNECSQEMQYQFSPISTNESLLSVSSDENAEFEKRKETDEAEDTFKLSVYFESANIRNDTFVFLKHVKGNPQSEALSALMTIWCEKCNELIAKLKEATNEIYKLKKKINDINEQLRSTESENDSLFNALVHDGSDDEEIPDLVFEEIQSSDSETDDELMTVSPILADMQPPINNDDNPDEPSSSDNEARDALNRVLDALDDDEL